MADWEDETGLVALPGGARVRGRRLGDPASPADFALVLGKGAPPAWPFRRVRWPDFGVPADRGDALDALGEAHRRALAGERVEVACRGGPMEHAVFKVPTLGPGGDAVARPELFGIRSQERDKALVLFRGRCDVGGGRRVVAPTTRSD